jgi:hypothetical protein
MTLPVQLQKKKRRTIHSISFKEDDLKIIQLAAQQEGISFAAFLKNATLEYIRESLEYQRLEDSGGMSKEQKAMPEAFSAFEDTIKGTLLSIHESINWKLKKIDWMLEHSLFYQFYFNRVMSEEERVNMAKVAQQRMKTIMGIMKEEIGQEKSIEMYVLKSKETDRNTNNKIGGTDESNR